MELFQNLIKEMILVQHFSHERINILDIKCDYKLLMDVYTTLLISIAMDY